MKHHREPKSRREANADEYLRELFAEVGEPTEQEIRKANEIVDAFTVSEIGTKSAGS